MTPPDAVAELTADLAEAVARDEMRVHYLPLVRLSDGRTIGVEALARWCRDGRLLDTQQFLHLAEKTGHILGIGRWVMERACRDVAGWNAEHPGSEPLRLAVNVSLHQLTEPDAVDHLRQVLGATGLDPHLLSIEVSENALHELGHAVGPTFLAMKDLGVRISVDDFGTGASSLVALQRYDLDELKIDRSFIDQMDVDADAAAIVRGVVRLADSLGLDTVAEGVERVGQEQTLRALGCHVAQGWLYAKPTEDLTVAVATADEAALGLLERIPVEHRELWDGSPSTATAARFVEAVFEFTPIGMALIDETGRHLAANPAIQGIIGYEADALLDMTCWEIVHPEDLPADLAGMDDLLAGRRPTYVVEERMVGADGQPRWVEVTVCGVPGDHRADGTPTRLLRQVRNIEGSRRAGEAATVLRSVVAASPDALVITDAVGRCTLWNPAAERLFGWTEEEMVGAPLTRLVATEGHLQMARLLGDAAAGTAVRWSDATWLTSSGDACAVDVIIAPIVDPNGARFGLVALARDVTEQRAAGLALRDAHEALGIHVADLAAANVRLATLAGTLAHDLMQPVAVLDGFLSLLEREVTELDDEHRGWLQGAIRGKDRMSQAIDALYRNAAEEDLHLVAVDLGRVVEDLLPGLVTDLGDAEVVVGDLPVVVADRGFVTQVLANLVQNSSRYRHEERPLVIELDARADGRSWVVSVIDSGKGISTDELEGVFEAGRRGRASEGTDGTGTGLATVRTLMLRMGGDAWAQPEPLGGVRMCLRFRAAPG